MDSLLSVMGKPRLPSVKTEMLTCRDSDVVENVMIFAASAASAVRSEMDVLFHRVFHQRSWERSGKSCRKVSLDEYIGHGIFAFRFRDGFTKVDAFR